MDDLVQFLRDRLDEDEQTARAATWDEQSDVWAARPPQARYEQYIVADYLDDGVVVVTPENADADGVGQHIARHDPARILREVEAKRRMIEAYARSSHGERTAPHDDMRDVAGAKADSWRFTLRLLALSYADHPDYRDDWRP